MFAIPGLGFQVEITAGVPYRKILFSRTAPQISATPLAGWTAWAIDWLLFYLCPMSFYVFLCHDTTAGGILTSSQRFWSYLTTLAKLGNPYTVTRVLCKHTDTEQRTERNHVGIHTKTRSRSSVYRWVTPGDFILLVSIDCCCCNTGLFGWCFLWGCYWISRNASSRASRAVCSNLYIKRRR